MSKKEFERAKVGRDVVERRLEYCRAWAKSGGATSACLAAEATILAAALHDWDATASLPLSERAAIACAAAGAGDVQAEPYTDATRLAAVNAAGLKLEEGCRYLYSRDGKDGECPTVNIRDGRYYATNTSKGVDLPSLSAFRAKCAEIAAGAKPVEATPATDKERYDAMVAFGLKDTGSGVFTAKGETATNIDSWAATDGWIFARGDAEAKRYRDLPSFTAALDRGFGPAQGVPADVVDADNHRLRGELVALKAERDAALARAEKAEANAADLARSNETLMVTRQQAVARADEAVTDAVALRKRCDGLEAELAELRLKVKRSKALTSLVRQSEKAGLYDDKPKAKRKPAKRGTFTVTTRRPAKRKSTKGAK